MAITKLWIEDGCIACGVCVDTAPEIFEMKDTAVVKNNADFSQQEDAIKEAAEACPVEVIKYE